jgi:hypothetical protein
LTRRNELCFVLDGDDYDDSSSIASSSSTKSANKQKKIHPQEAMAESSRQMTAIIGKGFADLAAALAQPSAAAASNKERRDFFLVFDTPRAFFGKVNSLSAVNMTALTNAFSDLQDVAMATEPEFVDALGGASVAGNSRLARKIMFVRGLYSAEAPPSLSPAIAVPAVAAPKPKKPAAAGAAAPAAEAAADADAGGR